MKVEINAIISNSTEMVWNCWTNPEHIINWNFASEDWQCPKATNDLRAGGKYTTRMEAKDGSFGFDFIAVYDEVEPLKKLTYTMEDGRQVATIFEPTSDATKVTSIFDAENENPVEMQKQGWQSILDNFKKYVESLK